MAHPSGFRAVVALATLALVTQGCASGRVPAAQTVRVETPHCSPMVCELHNDLGSWQLAETPGAVVLAPSRAPLQVSCRDERGARSAIQVPSHVAPSTGAGGVAGAVAGGAATGAVFGTAALTFIPVLGAIVLLTGLAAGAVAGQGIEAGARVVAYPALILIPPACSAGVETTGLSP